MTHRHRFGVVVLTLWALSGAHPVQADILLSQPLIQTGLACTPICGPGEAEWSYLGGVSQNGIIDSTGAVPGVITPNGLSLVTKDYFTVMDFLGYVPGSAQGPAGWSFQSLNVGSVPFNIVAQDNPLIPNLTWYYTGAPLLGPQVLGLFSARTTALGEALGEYVASATNDGTARGSQDNKITETLTPAAVPEPASLLLLGTGLLGFVAYYRRRQRKLASVTV